MKHLPICLILLTLLSVEVFANRNEVLTDSLMPKATNPKCPLPEYPATAKANQQEGRVLASLHIDISGNVSDVKIVKSSGNEELDQATQEAFMKCRFTPAMRDGMHMDVWQSMAFTWKLE